MLVSEAKIQKLLLLAKKQLQILLTSAEPAGHPSNICCIELSQPQQKLHQVLNLQPVVARLALEHIG